MRFLGFSLDNATTANIILILTALGGLLLTYLKARNAQKTADNNENTLAVHAKAINDTAGSPIVLSPPPTVKEAAADASNRLGVVMLVLCFGFSLTGCGADPRAAAVREALDGYGTPLLKEYGEMIHKYQAPADVDESTAHAAGQFTAQDVSIRQTSIDGFAKVIADERAADKKASILNFFAPPATQPSN